MPKPRKNRSLVRIMVLVWLIALVLGGGLIGAVSLGVFDPPALVPAPAAALPETAATLDELPATWTPAPDAPGAGENNGGGAQNGESGSGESPANAETEAPGSESGENPSQVFEPTFTPENPFPPSPTFIFTPVPFSDGPIVIGHSVLGRPLEVYRFGTGPVHRMIVAGIHGGYEWNTTALAYELIEHIEMNPEIIPHTVTLYILVTLNPDGYARAFGVDGRVNTNGVDLNRNFPVNWAADWDRQRCWNYAPTTSGAGPGSEPETRALIDFILDETRVTALISYHSAALGVFPGGEPPHEPSARLAEAIAAVSTYPYPPIDIGCFYTGTLADWAAAEGIAAVDLELHTHVLTDFEENLEILEMFLAWRR